MRGAVSFLVALLVLLAGFGLMWLALDRQRGLAGPEDHRLLMVAKEGLPPEIAGQGVPVTVRFLPAQPDTARLVERLRLLDNKAAERLLAKRREKLVLMPDFARNVSPADLDTGRLPRPGAPEVVAGALTLERERVSVAGREFRVVGVRRTEVSPLSSAYLLPEAPGLAGLFDPSDDDVAPAVLVPDETVRALAKTDRKLLARPGLRALGGVARMSAENFYLDLAGLALLLLGGSTLLVGGILAWSRRAGGGWVGTTLAEVQRYRGLLVAVHLAYFGLLIVSAAVIFLLPDVQDLLLTVIGQQISDRSTVLGVAGEAYASSNIARAAVVTLAINLCVGSLAEITLPSLVVPGAGSLVSMFRATLWGVLLAPSQLVLVQVMLPHSFTLLLEGEGYILATFFALLVPVYLVRSAHGPSAGARWWAAIKLNLAGNFFVALVLAVAALYEATEVILQQ